MVNQANLRGATPLHYACDESFKHVAEILLDMDARSDPTTQDLGESAFYCAVANQLTQTVKKMHKKDPGAVKNRLLGHTTTVLHIAVKLGYVDMVETLLKCKSDLRAIDSDDKRPIQLAESRSIKDILLNAVDEENSKLAVQMEDLQMILESNPEVRESFLKAGLDLKSPASAKASDLPGRSQQARSSI
jgi:ankyrin repeat protein